MTNKNNVILHYRRTGGEKEQIDTIVDADLELEVCDAEGKITKVKAKDCKGVRASLPLDFGQNGEDHDDQYGDQYDKNRVRQGYAWVMSSHPTKGKQIKLPKKEKELRELFGLTDEKKASIWSNDYDDFDITSLVTEKDRLSFLRGVYSAKARIVPGAKGYISCYWDKFPAYSNLSDEESDYFINEIVAETGRGAPEYNSFTIFYQSRDDLYFFIKNIGFVQKTKMDALITSYRQHLRIVNDVLPVDKTYLLNHVVNHGQPSDYNDELAQKYDVNCQNKKDGNTPLHLASDHNKWKNDSLYPAIWLLQHGADIDIKNKKKVSGRDMLKQFITANYYDLARFLSDVRASRTQREIILPYVPYLFQKVFEDNTELTKEFAKFVFEFNYYRCSWYGLSINGSLDPTTVFQIDPNRLDKSVLLSTVIQNIDKITHNYIYYNPIEKYDKHEEIMTDPENKEVRMPVKIKMRRLLYTDFLTAMIDMSMTSIENHDKIMEQVLELLNKKLDDLIDPPKKKFVAYKKNGEEEKKKNNKILDEGFLFLFYEVLSKYVDVSKQVNLVNLVKTINDKLEEHQILVCEDEKKKMKL